MPPERRQATSFITILKRVGDLIMKLHGYSGRWRSQKRSNALKRLTSKSPASITTLSARSRGLPQFSSSRLTASIDDIPGSPPSFRGDLSVLRASIVLSLSCAVHTGEGRRAEAEAAQAFLHFGKLFAHAHEYDVVLLLLLMHTEELALGVYLFERRFYLTQLRAGGYGVEQHRAAFRALHRAAGRDRATAGATG